ncbi:NEW3 domain-containing protein [Cellulosimicrobium arenosum]|uniref:Alpha-galactosidase NEW3 domain-containing protein n=1 Tax=Cellulosimicrobium arenosum TaxID=2708133 RepID=A0A927J0M2_9MICO|nr:NEW3 domain-containing protein [Cellulosimicrobium arenosum]MBD8079672.1 hypothetical protein [Cellulosimicrobium arenosum]
MGTLATLDATSIALIPGEEVTVPLTVRNTGTIVEAYRLEVLGVPAGWTVVEPAMIEGLYPETATTATLTFRPPRNAEVPAGELQFGIRVIPLEHPDEAVVPEGVVEVLPFLDTTAELVPRTTHGRRGAKHQVAVDNRGNTPMSVILACADGTDDLVFTVKEPLLTVAPGTASFTDVKVRPRKTFWRGADKTLPFVVQVEADNSVPVTLDGTHVQTALLPKWFLKALLALLALLVLLVVLWFTLLKPAITSAAKEAVGDDLTQAQEAAEEAQEAAKEASSAAQEASGAASDANVAATEAGTTLSDTEDAVAEFVPPSGTSVPVRQRLDSQPGAGETDSVTFEVPEKSTLTIDDVILSNPQGDFGRLTISQDDDELLDFALENFRDLDYHFQSPITLAKGSVLTMEVTCRQPGAPLGEDPAPDACDTSMYFGGTMFTPDAEKAGKDSKESADGGSDSGSAP